MGGILISINLGKLEDRVKETPDRMCREASMLYGKHSVDPTMRCLISLHHAGS